MTNETSAPSAADDDLPALRQAIGQRLAALVARLPQVRSDAQELHRQVGPIAAARQHCKQFVDGEHRPLLKLTDEASRLSQEQSQSIQLIQADLHRSVEFAAAFAAARAESFLQLEATAVVPAEHWATFARSRVQQSQDQLAKAGEWLALKQVRWLPEQTARRGTTSKAGEPAVEGDRQPASESPATSPKA